MESVQYEGFLVTPKTYQLANDGRWALAIDIMKGNELRPYSTSNTFETRDEAIRACIQFGQAVIDGRVPGLSTLDLPGR
jgi:hypothetical protein